MEDARIAELSTYLSPLGWPRGLQRTVLTSCQTCPLRFFIIDDSGSMCANDGHQLVGSGASKRFDGICFEM